MTASITRVRYYLLRQDARRDYWRAMFVEGISLDAFRAGLPLGAPTAPVRVHISAFTARPSDYLGSPVPVVSEAMRDALQGAGVDNVQYFRTQVVVGDAADEPVAEYWAANVVGAVACAMPLDAGATRAATGVAPADGPLPNFRIDARRARGCDLFRLAEDRRLVVVSESVADRLRAANLRGLVLQPPEEYDGRRVSTASPEPGAPEHGGVARRR